jgi:hypothetical protein
MSEGGLESLPRYPIPFGSGHHGQVITLGAEPGVVQCSGVFGRGRHEAFDCKLDLAT